MAVPWLTCWSMTIGDLARVSFNLDGLIKRAGAHGKQALTMCMGFCCNAAGVVATR